jgi:hypothetical protein
MFTLVCVQITRVASFSGKREEKTALIADDSGRAA